ncbi:hypothetical protein [Cesiribacter andamanensis]|nr:hypothetical protein [Cesiribacter andamanensis]
MKFTIVPVFLLFKLICLTVVSSYGQINNKILERTWIAVDSRQEGNGGIFPIDGTLIRFKDGVAEVTFIGSDSVKSLGYKLRKNKIRLSGERPLGVVRHLSQDSLTILIGKHMVTLFKPTLDFKPMTSRGELVSLLTSSAWHQLFDNYKIRIDFLEEGWDFNEDPFRVGITHLESNHWYYKENERWAVSEFDGKYFISITHNQFDNYVYQIKKVTSSRIETELFTPTGYQPVTFELIERKKDGQLEELTQILTSQVWMMAELEYHHQFERETENEAEEQLDFHGWSGFSTRADSLLLKDEFINKEIAYQFLNDGGYRIIKGEEVLKKGKWSLSKDGKFIILDYETNPLNYLEIKELKNKELVVRQNVDLQLKRGETAFISYDTIIKFK